MSSDDRPLPPLPDEPEAGSYWVHRNTGQVYIVRSVGCYEPNLEPVVIYSPDAGSSFYWVRPHVEFMKRFHPHLGLREGDHNG